jgi:serine/threonine protein kinase
MNDRTAALPAGTPIASFQIRRLLGVDGFGFIYEGSSQAGSAVIIREFFPRAIASRQTGPSVVFERKHRERWDLALNRLERLSNKLRQFRHPNFVKVLDFERLNDTGYVVMARCEGESLETWLQARATPPDPTELMPIVAPILDALATMHRKGGVHQDVSPLSIVIGLDGQPILAGGPTFAEVVAIAGRRAPSLSEMSPTASCYLAPEQVAAVSGLRAPTDMYAVGAVLYRCFTGQPPVEAARRIGSVRFELSDPYVRVRDAAKVELTSAAAAAIDQALALRSKDRLHSIDELGSMMGWMTRADAVIAPVAPRETTFEPDQSAVISAVIAPPEQTRRPPPLRPLSLAELAAHRAQAVVDARPINPPSHSAIPAPPAVKSRPLRTSSWLGGVAVIVGAIALAVQYNDKGSTTARLHRNSPGGESDVPLIISLLAVVAVGFALVWTNRGRLQTLLGAVRGRLRSRQDAPGVPPIAADQSQLVDVSAFAPRTVPPGGRALVQVYLHVPGQAAEAAKLAKEADREADRRGVRTLSAVLAVGQTVQVALDAPGLRIDEPVQSLVWTGEPCACQFLVKVPRTAAGATFHLRVRVMMSSVPVGALRFTLTAVARENSDPSLGIRGDAAHENKRAFLSYAAPDRAEVLRTVQTLNAAHIGFFLDLLSLTPGERWEKRLYEEIDRCDLFLLFWSSDAAKSKWVTREAEYALKRRQGGTLPEIAPIILEGPPVPPVPDSLKDIHFNDWVRYVISRAEMERRKT